MNKILVSHRPPARVPEPDLENHCATSYHIPHFWCSKPSCLDASLHKVDVLCVCWVRKGASPGHMWGRKRSSFIPQGRFRLHLWASPAYMGWNERERVSKMFYVEAAMKGRSGCGLYKNIQGGEWRQESSPGSFHQASCPGTGRRNGCMFLIRSMLLGVPAVAEASPQR